MGNVAKLPVNSFKWVEDISEFDESFIKIYNQESDEGYFRKVDLQYPNNLHDFITIYHFYLK